MKSNILTLINQANDIPLDNLAVESMKFLGKASHEDIEQAKVVIDIANFDDDLLYLSTVLSRFVDLDSKDSLPEFQGIFNLKAIIESEEYEHMDYVEPFAEDGMIEVFDRTYADHNVPSDSVQVIMPLQESEVIVSCRDFDGCYYILYHDAGVSTMIANSHENFLKSFYILSLMMLDEEIFKESLALLDNHKNEELDNVFKCVGNIVFSASDFVDEVKNVSDRNSLIDTYWEYR